MAAAAMIRPYRSAKTRNRASASVISGHKGNTFTLFVYICKIMVRVVNLTSIIYETGT